MKMKKILSVLLIVCMLLSVVACTREEPAPSGTAPSTQTTDAPTDAPPTDPTDASTDPADPTDPSGAPVDPTGTPTDPTDAPVDPTGAPVDPTQAATQKPTQGSTQKPTQAATQKPTQGSTQKPTQAATQKPTQAATQKPTQAPTQKPTQPKPTEPTGPLPQKTIEFEAEDPVSKKVDTEKRTDVNGYAMDHSTRKLDSDGLQYVDSAKTKINFAAFDSYTYTFESDEAGKYILYIVASCDRDSPVRYTLNSSSGTGYFARNDFKSYDQIDLGVVEVKKGSNTLTVTITENKNHNMYTDKYVLIPEHIVNAEKVYDWTETIDNAHKAEKIETETANKVWKELYVATNGKDSNPGTKSAPFATIAGAAKAVAGLRSQMKGDIVVHVASGVYSIKEPIVLGVDAGGANGYRVIYRGDSSDKPVISGGVKITGWTKGSNGIWSAPCNVADTRTLYINDNMAVRARSEYLYVATKNHIKSGSKNKSDGMVVKANNFKKLSNPEDVELVFDSEWMHHRYPVANILYGSGTVTFEMQQPYWHALHNVNSSNVNDPGVGKGFYIENAKELLDEPGEFYFDKDAKRIYYYPFSNENMATAKCYVGVSEGLLQIKGTNGSTLVNGLTLENLQFKYGAWNEVSETGMLTNQADNLENTSNRSAASHQVPGQVEVKFAKNITVRGCVFACLGSTALAMPNAVSDSVIDGNVFKDISGVAISISTDKHYNNTSTSIRPINIDVTNNVIRRIGAEFRSSPAIIMYYVTAVRVMHNDIACVPYTGISLGWGWGKDVKDCKDNVIAYNKIYDVASPTHDGAHIYVLSPNYNTYINNNWCVDSGDMRGGIYPDEGAAHLNIFHNVIEDMHTYWIYARAGVYLRDINAFQNYVDTDKAHYDTRNVIMDGNVIVKDGNWPDEAKNIMNGAGVQSKYKSLLNGINYPSWRTNFVKEIPNEY